MKNYVNRETSVSPERTFNSPIKQRLRKSHKKELEVMKKKIKCLTQRLKRAERRIAYVERILDKLQYKKYLGDGQLKKLADIGKGNKDLLKRQIQKLSHANLPKQYSPE